MIPELPITIESKDKYTNRYKKAKYIFILLGLFWTVLGVSQIVFNEFRLYTFIFLIGGPLFIIQAILSQKHERGRYIIISEDNIKLKQNTKNEELIKWNDILNVSIKNSRIHIQDSTGNVHSIRLFDYPAAKKMIIINSVKSFSGITGFAVSNQKSAG